MFLRRAYPNGNQLLLHIFAQDLASCPLPPLPASLSSRRVPAQHRNKSCASGRPICHQICTSGKAHNLKRARTSQYHAICHCEPWCVVSGQHLLCLARLVLCFIRHVTDVVEKTIGHRRQYQHGPATGGAHLGHYSIVWSGACLHHFLPNVNCQTVASSGVPDCSSSSCLASLVPQKRKSSIEVLARPAGASPVLPTDQLPRIMDYRSDDSFASSDL